MTTVVAMPAAAVELPSPATVPAPAVFVKVTTVELSEVAMFPAASRSVAVRVLAAPETLEPERASPTCVGAPCTIV